MILSPAGEIAVEEWQRTAVVRPNVVLDAWVVMPNHIHGILFLTNDARHDPGVAALHAHSLGIIIGQFKGSCTRRIRASGDLGFAWQDRYYDHIIRSSHALERIQAYIYNNPTQWENDRENPGRRR
jgi:REP element-mobilizing transposase RayT